MLLDSDTQLNHKSYYEASVQRPAAEPPLAGSHSADVLVVGAGFAGLSAAIELAQRGYAVVVLEADRVCSGASGRNGGQTNVGFACGQATLEQHLGQADARLAWDMSLQANALLDARIAQHQIDCDRVKGYLYVAETARKARALEDEMTLLERSYDFKSQLYRGAQTQDRIQSPRYCAAVFEQTSGHVHPLKYGLGLAQAARSLGVRIYERSAVTELVRGSNLVAHTAHASVTARWGVLAGNCTLAEYGPCVAPEITPRIMPVGTYIIGTAPLDPVLCRKLIPSNAAVCDNNFVLEYLRFSADHRMLFGGRCSYTARTPRNLQALMTQRLARVFPQLKGVGVDYVWGGFVDISMNRAPDFGRLGSNLYYLQGFSGQGVTLTGLAGKLVAEALAGQAERFDLLARISHRNFPGGALLRAPSLALAMLFYRLRDAFY